MKTPDVAAADIRIRRLPPSRFLRRRRYEVEFTARDAEASVWSRVTSTPVSLIDRSLGVGDAWSLINAADRAWAGGTGAWVSLYAQPDEGQPT